MRWFRTGPKRSKPRVYRDTRYSVYIQMNGMYCERLVRHRGEVCWAVVFGNAKHYANTFMGAMRTARNLWRSQF